VDPQVADLLDRLERDACAQKEYFRKKQAGLPCLDDFYDEEGLPRLPDDIGPLLGGAEANGRYSEADWWIARIKALRAELGGQVEAGGDMAV
jgi:hypothetical protein